MLEPLINTSLLNCRNQDYSMIVATRPDPTVRPPSRYQTGVLLCANGDFSCDSCGKIRIFRCVRVVFGDFVIMVLSRPYYLCYALFGNNLFIFSTSFSGSEPFMYIYVMNWFNPLFSNSTTYELFSPKASVNCFFNSKNISK